MSERRELTGTIKAIMDMETFDSGFTKREFVITTGEDYPQDVKLECIKDRCTMLDGHSVGDKVTALFNIRGNEYNDRYYVNLQCWRIEEEPPDDECPPDPTPEDLGAADGGDTLPF